MSGNEIRQKYLDFMEKNGHAIIPSSALVPDNDPTTLVYGKWHATNGPLPAR